jgi:hypothetical protein
MSAASSFTCGTRWSAGNQVGVLYNPGSGNYVRASGIFVTPTPAVPGPSNQYEFAFVYDGSSGSSFQFELYEDSSFATPAIDVPFESNGTIRYMNGVLNEVKNTGLTWASGTGEPATFCIKLTSTNTFQLSMNKGTTWTSNFTNFNPWTSQCAAFSFYAGTQCQGYNYFDNITTSWGVAVSSTSTSSLMLQEDFQHFTVGQSITGTTENVTWNESQYMSTASSFTCGTRWAAGNQVGVLYNPGGGNYARAGGIFVTPTPAVPGLINQYEFSFVYEGSAGDSFQFELYEDSAFQIPAVDVPFESNGTIRYYNGALSTWKNTGLTWTPGSGGPATFCIRITGTDTFQLSVNNGINWTTNYTNENPWTSPCAAFSFYAGTQCQGYSYFDNIATSWNAGQTTPTAPYLPLNTIIIIIIVSGMSVGIVVSASYAQARKKAKIVVKPKATIQQSFTGGSPRENAAQNLAAISKRDRLLRVSMPADVKPTEVNASVDIPFKEAAVPKKKETEEIGIDMERRVANANQMASEVKVDSPVPRCIVHKGPISGLNYTCKHCHVAYCMKCYTFLIEAHENCWNCNQPLELVSTEDIVTQDEFEDVPNVEATVFKPEILDKVDSLDLDPDAKKDVLALLKEVPPEQRLERLDEISAQKPDREDEDWF